MIKYKKNKLLIVLLVFFLLIFLFKNIKNNNQYTFENIANKIWIIENDNELPFFPYEIHFSFFIENIDKKNVTGKFATRNLALPDFYLYSNEPSDFLGNLEGYIADNNTIIAEFKDILGDSGYLEITYISEKELKVKVNYLTKRELHKEYKLDGIFKMRPYSTDDVDNLSIIEDKSVYTNFKRWGDVRIIACEIKSTNNFYPALYIINDNSEILYNFYAPYQTATRISSLKITDYNKDGLNDVIVICDFVVDKNLSSMPTIKRIFLQNKNGEFVAPKLWDYFR